jgi:hypothetical protein
MQFCPLIIADGKRKVKRKKEKKFPERFSPLSFPERCGKMIKMSIFVVGGSFYG